ncbi:hypothetical protein [Methanocorpusculum petauri]|uniref:hypothetical protein n=1 Tax=Methanocorpusculum petauri TaxID=3002863 RepID=UPI0022A791EA|nr:hypothetical protein [Methanocorpusculum petauri]
MNKYPVMALKIYDVERRKYRLVSISTSWRYLLSVLSSKYPGKRWIITAASSPVKAKAYARL